MDADGSHIEGAGKVGRPRSEKSHQAILNAAMELLAEQGLNGMTMEGVAERAGVGKMTIYRRWANKEELAVAALGEVRAKLTIPLGLPLREAIHQFLTQLRILFQEHPLAGDIFFRLLGETDDHPELVKALYNQVNDRVGMALDYVHEAQATGEIDPDLDWSMAAGLIAGPLFYQMVVFKMGIGPEVTPAMVDLYTDVILRALKKPAEG